MDAPLNSFGFLLKIALYVGAEASGGGEFRVGRPGVPAYDRVSPPQPPDHEVKFQLMGQPGVGQGLHRAEGSRPGSAAGRHGAAP